jgi:hypothetical protein
MPLCGVKAVNFSDEPPAAQRALADYLRSVAQEPGGFDLPDAAIIIFTLGSEEFSIIRPGVGKRTWQRDAPPHHSHRDNKFQGET